MQRGETNAGPSTAAARKPEIISRSLCPALTSAAGLCFLEAIRVETKSPVVVQEIYV